MATHQFLIPIPFYSMACVSIEPHVIISRYDLTMKQTKKNDFQKRTRYAIINQNDEHIFLKISSNFLLCRRQNVK